MAGITMSGAEEKKFQTQKPAADGYSYNYAVTPNKVLANSGTSMKDPGGTTAPQAAPPANGKNDNSGNKGYNATDISGVYTGNKNNGNVRVSVTESDYVPYTPAPTVSAPAGPTAQQQAETSLAQLREDYAKALRDQYNYSADRMKTERDEALRENWVLQQQAEAALPEQLAARGINGGAAETTLANLRAQYQGNRNDIRGGYMDEMGDLAQSHSQMQAEGQRSYNERWLEYLMDLARMDEQYKKDVALKAMGN